jgi:predicted membrane protein
MSRINVGRLILGGIVAGVVSNALSFVINNYLMVEEGTDMMQRLNLSSEKMSASIPVWAAVDLIWGLLLVWVYVGFRPRFGPGPKTAAISGFTLWFAVCVIFAGLTAMGIYTQQAYIKSSALMLVSTLLSSLAGAAVYKE